MSSAPDLGPSKQGSDIRVKEEPLDDAKILSMSAETDGDALPPSNSNVAALFGERFWSSYFLLISCSK